MLEVTTFNQNQAIQDMGELTQFPPAFFGVIRDLPLFCDLSREDIETAARYMRAYIAQEDTVLFREGDYGDHLLVVVEGLIQVIVQREGEDLQTVALLERGKPLGELALIDGKPRSATCVAMQDSVFLVLTRWGLNALGRDHPAIALRMVLNLAVEISARVRQTTTKLIDVLTV